MRRRIKNSSPMTNMTATTKKDEITCMRRDGFRICIRTSILLPVLDVPEFVQFHSCEFKKRKRNFGTRKGLKLTSNRTYKYDHLANQASQMAVRPVFLYPQTMSQGRLFKKVYSSIFGSLST
jgi:hypothetical protein